MKSFILSALLMLAPVIAQAQSDASAAFPGFILRNDASIEAAADRLEKELGDKGMVFETIGNHDGHSLYLVLRGKTGTSERHLTESDYYIGVRGSATFVIGGEIIDGENLPRKQIRGSGIEGGERRVISPGDIVHVPPDIPHHLIIDPDQPYMYLLFKIDEEPLN